jgi:glycosyltransferase involved in cell wall biosynthesis
MKSEFVSVAMLSYNHEKYLAKALDSVLMQETNFSFVIVIGDDCSPDRSQEIINTYAKRYPDKFRTICRKHNLGMNENFVDVLHHCEGKYIAYLEGDDYWINEHKLQKQIDFLEANAEYSAVSAQCRCIDQDNNILIPKMTTYCQKPDYELSDLKAFVQPGHMSTFVMRNIFSKQKDLAGVKLSKTLYDFDIETMLKYRYSTGDRLIPIILMSLGKFRCLDDIMSVYRFDIRPSSTSWSSKHNAEVQNGNIQDFLRLEELEKFSESIDFPTSFRRKKIAYYSIALYYAYVHRNKGMKTSHKQMRKRMNHNLFFVLSGYRKMAQLCFKSIVIRFKSDKKSMSLDNPLEKDDRNIITRNI